MHTRGHWPNCLSHMGITSVESQDLSLRRALQCLHALAVHWSSTLNHPSWAPATTCCLSCWALLRWPVPSLHWHPLWFVWLTETCLDQDPCAFRFCCAFLCRGHQPNPTHPIQNLSTQPGTVLWIQCQTFQGPKILIRCHAAFEACHCPIYWTCQALLFCVQGFAFVVSHNQAVCRRIYICQHLFFFHTVLTKHHLRPRFVIVILT